MKKYIISGLFLAIVVLLAPNYVVQAETYSPCTYNYNGQTIPCDYDPGCRDTNPTYCHRICVPSWNNNCPTDPSPQPYYCQVDVTYPLTTQCTCPTNSTYTRFGYQLWNDSGMRFKCVSNGTTDPTPPTYYCQINVAYPLTTQCTCPTNSTYTRFGYQDWNGGGVTFKCVSNSTPDPVPPTYYCQIDVAYPLTTQCTCPTNSTYTRFGYQDWNGGGIKFKCVQGGIVPTPVTYKTCPDGSVIQSATACPVSTTQCNYNQIWNGYTCSSANTGDYQNWNDYSTQYPSTYGYDNYSYNYNYNDTPSLYDWSGDYTYGYSY